FFDEFSSAFVVFHRVGILLFQSFLPRDIKNLLTEFKAKTYCLIIL
ncbi:MAG: hypothetical protein ACI97P_003014, partial [Arcticibacterium sp.]